MDHTLRRGAEVVYHLTLKEVIKRLLSAVFFFMRSTYESSVHRHNDNQFFNQITF